MATVKDVARLAGVSHGTVSNVLNGNGNVSSEKILAVQKAAEALGYSMNGRAKSLREHKSDHLAVILPNLQHPQYTDFYTSFNRYASDHNYKVSLYLSENSPQREIEIIQELRAVKLAGIASYTMCDGKDDPYAQAGFTDNVLFVGHQPNINNNYIGFDYLKCGKELGEIAARYKSVALITENLTLRSQNEVMMGFMEKVSKVPACTARYYEKLGTHRAASIAMNVMSASPRPEAIFVTNYAIAETIRSIAERFFKVNDIKFYVVSPIFTFPENDFEKFEQNYRLLGKEAAETLLSIIEKKKKLPVEVKLPNYGFRSWNPSKVSDADSITVVTLDSPTAHHMRNMAHLYSAATGVKIKVNIMTYDGIHTALTNLDENSGFDVIRLDATWLSWFAEKIFEPIDQLDPDITKQVSTFLPGITPFYGNFSGKLYALPESPSTQMLFYRKDLFESSIIQRRYKETYKQELRPPRTFREYNQIARFFTREYTPSSPVAYGSTLTLGNTGVAATEFLTRFFSLTSNLFDEEDRIRLDSPEALEALMLLIDIKNYAPFYHSNWWRDTAQSFSKDEIAMTVLFSNYASAMIGRDSAINTNIGYAMVPGGNPLMGGGSIGVCRYSKNKKEALNFIRWFCSEEVSSAMTQLGSVSPCKVTYENYQVIDTYPWLSISQDSFKASHVSRWPAHSIKSFNEREFLNILGTNVLQAINGTQSAQESLLTAQRIYEESIRNQRK